MIISAWDCTCGRYHSKIHTNLLRRQEGEDYKKREVQFEITSVKRKCVCNKTKMVKVIS